MEDNHDPLSSRGETQSDNREGSPAQVRAQFYSTGTALQDVAAAIMVYENAQRVGKGRYVRLLS